MKNNNIDGEQTYYCKNVTNNRKLTSNRTLSNSITGCNNHIVSKNNVNSLNFSNISKRRIIADRLSSRAPRFISGLTIYGNIGERPVPYIPPQVYNQYINNGVEPNEKIKQYYVIQSLRLSLLSR
jgi:hypothetical protein